MKTFLRRLAIGLGLVGVLALLLLAFLGWRASRLPSLQPGAGDSGDTIDLADQVDLVDLTSLDGRASAERLAEVLRFETVSTEAGPPPATVLAEMGEFLETAFPGVHQSLEVEVFREGGEGGEGARLYHWPGSNPDLDPLLLLAHLDVVPAPTDGPQAWTHPPFAGVIEDGFIWGRGALDDKGTAMAQLEAVEALLAADFEPRRTVYLAFGHDEEVGGALGAQALVERLAERQVKPWLVLDEGFFVTHGLVPGFDQPVALIGISEKGYLSLELISRAASGHSSSPPQRTAVGALATAVDRLVEEPMPIELDGPVERFFRYLAPEVPWGKRLVLANLWLFGPMVAGEMAQDPGANALLRTTTAPTMLDAGTKDNVLPAEARATINFRIHPNDSVEKVIEHVRRVIADPDIEIRTVGFGSEPSPVSPAEGPAFELLSTTIHALFPEALIAPSLFVAATDSRHYTKLTPNVYRFAPVELGAEDVSRFHGVDERISVDAHRQAIHFYAQLVQSASRADSSTTSP